MSDRLRDLEVAFATLSATLTTKIDALIADGAPRHLDHETRLRALTSELAAMKIRVAWVAGGLGAGTGAGSVAVAHLLGL